MSTVSTIEPAAEPTFRPHGLRHRRFWWLLLDQAALAAVLGVVAWLSYLAGRALAG